MRDEDWDNHHVAGLTNSKRLAVTRPGWMGDWFTSHSPRNCNSNAEGQWGQWVELALSILQHPATELCRPDARTAVEGLVVNRLYDETTHEFSDEEIERYFGVGGAKGQGND